MTLNSICKICDALSNPTRIRFYVDLLKEPKSIYEIAKKFKVSRPMVYAHLKKLEEANLVECKMVIENGRAKKIYKALPFNLSLNPEILENLVFENQRED